MSRAPTIVNVGYRSTNFWVVSAGTSRLLVDLGWYGQFGTLAANLQRMDIPLREITHGLATHFHLDHAGTAQDLKDLGMRLIVTPEQVAWIPLTRQHVKPDESFTDIRVDDNLVVSCADSRALLATLGIDGQIVHTPGHSDDSVSLLLDTGAAFTGDLTDPAFLTDETAEQVLQSWHALRQLGATAVYPGHGPVRPIADP